jgi:hypothetical protein
MAEKSGNPNRRGAVKLSELVGKALDPIVARRGFASADLAATWSEIAGSRYADCTAPEKVQWPRGAAEGAGGGTLVLRVDGPRAVLIQHELGQIIERVNRYFGYAAVAKVKLVQGPVVQTRPAPPPSPAKLDPAVENGLAKTISEVESDPLRAALDRLGRGVLAKPFKEL